MPAKKKYAKSTRKSKPKYRRNYTKRPDTNKLDNRISIARQREPGVSDKQIVTMNYVDSQRFSGGATIIRYNQYNLNSIFDPDRTGVGHQPLSHDQWAAFYNKYRVFKTDYEVTFISNNNSNVPCAVWLQASNDVTAPNSITTYLEQSITSNFKSIGSNSPAVKMTGSVNVPALVGVTNLQYKTDDIYAATMTSSPTELAILNVVIASIDQLSIVDAYYTLKLTYHVELFDKFDLAQS